MENMESGIWKQNTMSGDQGSGKVQAASESEKQVDLTPALSIGENKSGFVKSNMSIGDKRKDSAKLVTERKSGFNKPALSASERKLGVTKSVPPVIEKKAVFTKSVISSTEEKAEFVKPDLPVSEELQLTKSNHCANEKKSEFTNLDSSYIEGIPEIKKSVLNTTERRSVFAKSGHSAIEKTKNANANLKMDARVSLFHNAIRNNNLDLVHQMLESGMSPNAQNLSTFKCPLIEATTRGFTSIVRALIAAQADVNQSNIQGNTPLHACVNASHFQKDIALLYLEQRKTNFNLQEKTTGNTPLHNLIRIIVSSIKDRADMVDVLKEMIPRCDANIQNKYGNTALHVVAMGKHDYVEAAEILLAASPDVNVQNNNGETPLCTAIINGKFKITKAILECSVNTQLKDRHGCTPLHYAAIKNAPDILRRLLEKGSNINERDLNGDTPLHLAAGRGFYEVVETLLMQEALRVNAQNDNGYTPLMCAIDSGFIKVVKLLVNHNCDINVISHQSDETALDIARGVMQKRNKRDIYDLLLTHVKE